MIQLFRIINFQEKHFLGCNRRLFFLSSFVNEKKLYRPIECSLRQRPLCVCMYVKGGLIAVSVAPTGDHVISLVDEISFTFPPAPPLSQIDDIPPEQFCNGDNRPADCGANCMCTHKVDIPYNAVVEVVLVDEGNETVWGLNILDL